MNGVEIEISDDRWFRGEWDFRPQDKQLCVVILKHDDRIKKNLLIMQWMASDTKESGGYFAEIPANKTDKHKRFYTGMYFVDRWKPLGLPADVEERVLAEIEKIQALTEIFMDNPWKKLWETQAPSYGKILSAIGLPSMVLL